MSNDDLQSSFRQSKDVLSDETPQHDYPTTIELNISDLPAVIKVDGARHSGYIIKMSSGGRGVIMEKLKETP